MLILFSPNQVKAAVGALLNTRGLNFPSSFDKQSKSGNLDVLDWLRAMFGFQACIIASCNDILVFNNIWEVMTYSMFNFVTYRVTVSGTSGNI